MVYLLQSASAEKAHIAKKILLIFAAFDIAMILGKLSWVLC